MSPADRVECEVVFFDVGGTLMEVSPSVGHVYATACGQRGARVDADRVQRAFDHAWVTLSSDVPRGANRYSLFPGGEKEWWQRISTLAFDTCEVPASARPAVDDLRDVFARPSAWRLYPETLEVLETLSDSGLRLGVISNWDSRLPALLESLGLHVHFESVIYSASAGYEKPHPAIFEAALSAFGVSAAAAVHIGDRLEEDYRGAREAGMRAVLIDRKSDLPGEVESADRVPNLRQASARIIGHEER